jgi:hypothetical protein
VSEPTPVPAPAPSEPLANKAVVAAFGSIVTVLLRWAVSGEFSLSDEGLVALAGAITTVGVYAVSNFRQILGLRSQRGQSLVGVLIGILLAVLAYWLCAAVGLPLILCVIVAIIVLLAAIPLGARF